jgi:small subunit ribosomal protein S21
VILHQFPKNKFNQAKENFVTLWLSLKRKLLLLKHLINLESELKSVIVLVRDNNVDQALRALKKKMQREGIFREMKLRRAFEKPSVKRARERAEAIRRGRKMLRKRLDREGY